MKYLWLLLNGHGGLIADAYAPERKKVVWPDGSRFFEGEFNRAIVARLMELMTAAGIPYVNLVPEHEDIPRQERVRRANAIYSKTNKECILLAIHSNKGGGSGYEVYTSPGETQSDRVATVFYNNFAALFPEIKMRSCRVDGDVDKEAKFTVLTETRMPAILTENLFYDNQRECRKYLMTKEGRDRIALAHFEAIKEI